MACCKGEKMYLDKRKMKEMVTAESYWCDGCFAYPFGEGIIEICHYFNNAGICPYQPYQFESVKIQDYPVDNFEQI